MIENEIFKDRTWTWAKMGGKPDDETRKELVIAGWCYSGKREMWYHTQAPDMVRFSQLMANGRVIASSPAFHDPRKASTRKTGTDYRSLYDQAHAEGMKAGNSARVIPMIVSEHASPTNDNSPIVKQWYVGDGACGFAWVNVKPANCGFARWLIEKGYARKDSHRGGVSLSVWEFNQSIARKEEYAYAFCKVLRAHGINTQAESRED